MATCARFTIQSAYLRRLSQRKLAGFVLAFAIGAAACTSTPSETPSAATDSDHQAQSTTTAPESSLPAPVAETDEAVSAPATSIATESTKKEADEPARTDGPDAELEGSEQSVASEPPSGYIAVSVGTAHTCAITVAGEIECWGDRTERRTEAPAGTYTAISAGHRHSCALSTNGEIACWGSNDFGRLNAPEGTFVAIDVERFQSCALAENGTARCWSLEEAPSPEEPNDANRYLDVAAGLFGSCAVTRAGEPDCWGYANDPPYDLPKESFVSIAGGGDETGEHWCALSTQGQVTCWGRGYPRGYKKPNDESFVEIAVSPHGHACAISTDAEVICWSGQSRRSGAPDGQFKSVAVGPSHACAVSLSGDVACWGELYSAAEDPPADTFTALAAGNAHTCGLIGDGTVRCWGNLPQLMADDLPPSTSIDAGWNHICAVTDDGQAMCRGYDYSLGRRYIHGGGRIPPGPYTTISFHEHHTCAIRIDERLACWGRNDYGQSDAPEGRYAAVAAGRRFTCAITIAGRAQCWGANRHGSTDPPAGTYTSIAAGWWHACGIREGGEAVCWGRNDFGQMDVPDGRYSRIATNERHTCAVTAAGELRCWGFNDMGQLDAPSGTYTDVVAGLNHSCALTPEGHAVCWGHGDRRALRTLTAHPSEEPIRVESPNELAGCCSYEEPHTFVELDTGFIKIVDNTPMNAPRGIGDSPDIYFSLDDQTWQRVDLPTRYLDGYLDDEVDIWVCSVDSWGDRVIIREAIYDFDPVLCGDHTYWAADEDLANWRKLLAPPPGFGETVDN